MIANESICYERKGNNRSKQSYVKKEGQSKLTKIVGSNGKSETFFSLVKSVFLPKGYPESVSEDYFDYQVWDTLQAYCSSITNTLAAQALLKGMGVGNKDATVLAATTTWLLKDGTGMLGRILFAWINGSALDYDCKRWRLFADVLNDFAIFMDLISPIFQEYFTFIVCLSGLFKSLVGVAGGATRAALTQHQAKKNNLADVSAKDGSQETLINLLALISSLILVPLISGKQLLIWLLFFAFTFLHIFANYKAVKSVVMNTFNLSRLHILTQHYMNTGGNILSIKEANVQEPVFFVPFTGSNQSIIGCQVADLTDESNELNNLKTIFKDLPYLLNVDRDKRKVKVALKIGVNADDVFQSSYHAEIVNYYFMKNKECLKDYKELLAILKESVSIVEKNFQIFIDKLHSEGWRTDYNLICDNDWRFAFNE